jgi:hypothetical protein
MHSIARIDTDRKHIPMTQSMMILIAGPYRSGTGDDPQKMADNLAALERAALPIFEKGHVPMIGEWAALPILRGAGGGAPGSETYDTRLGQHRDHPGRDSRIGRCASSGGFRRSTLRHAHALHRRRRDRVGGAGAFCRR